MNIRIELVVFDFEGTLVDFQWRLAEAEAELRQAFAAQGFGTAGNYAELWNAAADLAVPQGRLAALRAMLDLARPIYRQTAAYGHFGRSDINLAWERSDQVAALKSALG